MTFAKGQSGNPAGRARKSPELLEIEATCKEASPKAVARMISLMKSTDDRIALMACNSILDRAYGKPAQAVEHKGTVTHDISSLTDAELVAILAEKDGGGRGDQTSKRAKRLH